LAAQPVDLHSRLGSTNLAASREILGECDT
jgi:hypothetical protein